VVAFGSSVVGVRLMPVCVRWGLFEGVWQWWWLAEAFLGLGSSSGALERARYVDTPC
jgi:hypothetical protein